MSKSLAPSEPCNPEMQPKPKKTMGDRFTFACVTAGIIFGTLYRHDPKFHHVVQPYLHAFMPFLF